MGGRLSAARTVLNAKSCAAVSSPMATTRTLPCFPFRSPQGSGGQVGHHSRIAASTLNDFYFRYRQVFHPAPHLSNLQQGALREKLETAGGSRSCKRWPVT